MIRPAEITDSLQISDIYNYYVLNTHSTFELEAVTEFEMQDRIERVINTLSLPWLVCEVNDRIVGYSYATSYKPRKAYKRTVETSVYLHQDEFGKGYGSALYSALIESLKQSGHHAIIGGIALPNDGSIALHEKLGFKKIGVFREVGYKLDRWVDVGYWQLLI